MQPDEEWQAAIEAARTTADEMPFSTLPAVKNGVEASSASAAGKLLLAMLGVMAALALACVVISGLVSLMH